MECCWLLLAPYTLLAGLVGAITASIYLLIDSSVQEKHTEAKEGNTF